mgnify:CR=1 FL=1
MRNATGVYADIAAEAFPTQLTDDLGAAVDTAIAQTKVEVGVLLEALNDEYGKTIIMVTHDPHAAERAHRVIHLDKGTLSEGHA